MSNWMKYLLIGGVLVYGLTACSQSGNLEPAAGENGDSANQPPDGSDTGSLENQAPTESRSNNQGERNYDDLEIITLLPRDGIPAIDNPEFLSAAEADDEYAPDELVIGVRYDGDVRAYSIPFLSGHEIVNDSVGGRKIAVTW